ncbi:MAG TPA: universal stress protein [Chloroflexota bacterium]|nr:universal stress protein [Chloroflexota bacterium]
MFKHILVPLDGSDLAERAVPCAEQLAGTGEATLHLVGVVDLLVHSVWAPMPVYISDDTFQRELKQMTTYLEGLEAQLTARGLKVRISTLTGSVAATLLDYEHDEGIDLVVMCTHGRSGPARFALGSVAERLLHYGTVPLLMARAAGVPVNLAHAVVPLDGSALSESALDVVEQLAGSVVKEATFLRVVADAEDRPVAEKYLEERAARFQPDRVRCISRVEVGDPAEEILEAAGTNRLVVMATHGRTGLTRWAIGSVADRVARGGASAVIAVRSRAAQPA